MWAAAANGFEEEEADEQRRQGEPDARELTLASGEICGCALVSGPRTEEAGLHSTARSGRSLLPKGK